MYFYLSFGNGEMLNNIDGFKNFVRKIISNMQVKEKRKRKLESDKFNGNWGFVYFLRAKNEDIIKIGKSVQLNNRTEMIGIQVPFETTLEHYIVSDDYSKAEKHFHDVFENKKVKGEWYNLSEEDLIEIHSMDILTFTSSKKGPIVNNKELKNVNENKEYVGRPRKGLDAKILAYLYMNGIDTYSSSKLAKDFGMFYGRIDYHKDFCKKFIDELEKLHVEN